MINFNILIKHNDIYICGGCVTYVEIYKVLINVTRIYHLETLLPTIVKILLVLHISVQYNKMKSKNESLY
jgi:hypothetical protein